MQGAHVHNDTACRYMHNVSVNANNEYGLSVIQDYWKLLSIFTVSYRALTLDGWNRRRILQSQE